MYLRLGYICEEGTVNSERQAPLLFTVHSSLFMIRQLTKTGNSMALRLTKEMREHLGVTDSVDVQYVEGAIILRRPPMTFDQAKSSALDRLEGVIRKQG